MLEYERLLMLKLDDTMNDSPKTHACPMCGRCYKIRSTLNRHIRYECGMARKKLACEICGKKFSRPDNLKQHEQTHVTIYFSGETGAASDSANNSTSVCSDVKESKNSVGGGGGGGEGGGADKGIAPPSSQQIYLIDDSKPSLQSLQIQGQPVKIQLQNQPVKIQLQNQSLVQKIQLQNPSNN